jgi:hypothetical protein
MTETAQLCLRTNQNILFTKAFLGKHDPAHFNTCNSKEKKPQKTLGLQCVSTKIRGKPPHFCKTKKTNKQSSKK